MGTDETVGERYLSRPFTVVQVNYRYYSIFSNLSHSQMLLFNNWYNIIRIIQSLEVHLEQEMKRLENQ